MKQVLTHGRFTRRERDRQAYHRDRWAGLTHDEIMEGVPKYHKEFYHEHVSDMIYLKKYVWRKIFLSIFVWTPLAIWLVPFVYRFRKSNEWLKLNALVVITEMILILMLIFK